MSSDKSEHSANSKKSSTTTSQTKSHSSGHTLLSASIRKRAKASAALARFDYSSQEIELLRRQAVLNERHQLEEVRSKKEQTLIDLELKFLGAKKEIAVAVAEANALEGGFDDHNTNVLNHVSLESLGCISPIDRVLDYVQNNESGDPPPIDKHSTESVQPVGNFVPYVSLTSPPVISRYSQNQVVHSEGVHDHLGAQAHSTPYLLKTPKTKLPVKDDQLSLSYEPKSELKCARLNPEAKPFVSIGNNTSSAAEVGQFLLKKELLISRLTEFNERPENYESWKAGFKHLVTDLNLSPSDELEMLGKWLGPTSKRYAESYRNSNMSDPLRGVLLLWERLDRCYGTPEEIHASLISRLQQFEPISHDNPKRYYDLVDILSEIESLQYNKRYETQFAVFNTSTGVTPVAKRLLPPPAYEKWMIRASNYKLERDVLFPPFSVFVNFVKDMCRIRNDPSFTCQPVPSPVQNSGSKTTQAHKKQPERVKLSVKKTDVESENETVILCPIHLTKHSLNDCRAFRAKPISVRRKYLSENHLCFGCCLSKDHIKRNCTLNSPCAECNSSDHPTALHITFRPKSQGGEQVGTNTKSSGGDKSETKTNVNTKCTEICDGSFYGKSCAKIVLARVYHRDFPHNKVLTYVMLDDQSNHSLAKSQLLTLLNIKSSEIEYTVTTCSGSSNSSGRVAEGCMIESYDGIMSLALPPLIECDNIPENRQEIPTPEVAMAYPHLQEIQHYIQPLHDVQTLVLIGRDLATAHHVHDQRLPHDNPTLPFAQKLKLGWVIIGEACLGKLHRPNVAVNKTHLLSHGRSTMFQPCESNILIRERDLGADVFFKNQNDNKIGMSVEDKEFLHIMNNDFSKNDAGSWEAPLPFRSNRPTLPNNRAYTLHRARNLHNSLMKNKLKCEHMVDFVGKMLDHGHAEVAPALSEREECWYLPVFGVYHPQKPGQIRAVFDSSAQYFGVSLNNVLLSGPDLNNSLLNVLLRFRKDAIAATADIEQMFHSFIVKEKHRNFLRFFWYEDKDPCKPLIEYRMKVHLFGNSPSPAVACYGLQKTADVSVPKYGSDVQSFIHNHFYVDDGLISLPTSEEVVDLLQRTQSALKNEGNLCLHKFASNSPEVMKSFSADDLAKDLKCLDFENDSLPVQRSLGLIWDLQRDNFVFKVLKLDKPYTRRGVLSVINSLYDPLGFAAPVTVTGKLFLRQVMNNTVDWDDLLQPEMQSEWEKWKGSLTCLEQIAIPRPYLSDNVPFSRTEKSLMIFCDASEDAIAAVAYMKSGETGYSFVMGKAKVAPLHGHSLPRLELCAAVLAVEIFDAITDGLSFCFQNTTFFTDSHIVLGYINNRTRRFFMYVSNRVERIHQSSKPEQWKYIPTKANPADCATRAVASFDLAVSQWLYGPKSNLCEIAEEFPLIEPDYDKEVKPEVAVHVTTVSESATPVADRFSKYSKWKSLLIAVSILIHVVSSFKGKSDHCYGWHVCSLPRLPGSLNLAKLVILHLVQKEVFSEELKAMKVGMPVSRKSSLFSLDPYLDSDGLIRVGGRLSESKLLNYEKFPVVLPRSHHVSLLLVRHFHEKVHHQGRHITQGSLRSAGYWIIGEKRLISSLIYHCVVCRKLRGSFATQKMSDLPADRLTPAPPFTYVGIDVFGPWNFVYRKTRGAIVNSKRWAVLFTCLVVRAVHIEVIEEMTSSSFINALRRFVCIRGPVKEIRSDR